MLMAALLFFTARRMCKNLPDAANKCNSNDHFFHERVFPFYKTSLLH